ncbi:MAG: hypothetical protein ABI868_19935 [Acidobacteriota bacterium]
MKLLIKLALAALVANAAFRLGTAYLSYYRFTDAVAQTAQFGADRSRAELHRRILELSAEYDVPLDGDGFTIRRTEQSHTIVDGGYTQKVDLLPGYQYPWPFTMHVDVFTVRIPNPE